MMGEWRGVAWRTGRGEQERRAVLQIPAINKSLMEAATDSHTHLSLLNFFCYTFIFLFVFICFPGNKKEKFFF